MLLRRILGRRQLRVLGLNSGTSADGLDLAVLRIYRTSRTIKIGFVSGATKKYPPALREAVLKLADADTPRLDDLVRTHEALGQFYGRAAAAFICRLARQGVSVDVVASHGQTVRHLPEMAQLAGMTVRGSLQLGSLEQIAAHTGKLVTGDFRPADIALGNEGAPITTAAMARLFAGRDESRLIVNIGGMANYFYLPVSKGTWEAADCGPGNSLSDLLCRELFNEPYDRGGRRALAGKMSERLLTSLLTDPFFNDSTVSTGRERFGRSMAEKILSYGRRHRLSGNDLVATAAELTAVAIARKVRPYLRDDCDVAKLYLTGGGSHNRFFSRRLRQLLDFEAVCSIKELGYDPDLVEACAYAVLGEACLRSEVLPTGFGAIKPRKLKPVLGKIVQPPQRS